MFSAMKTTKQPVTRLDYCQYLLSSQINYTLTNFADHTTAFSHDKLNRYLAGDKITPDWFGKMYKSKWCSAPMVTLFLMTQ